MSEPMLGQPAIDPMALLFGVGQELVGYVRPPHEEFAWRWKDIVVPFPETRCFKCGGAFPNKAIWCITHQSWGWKLLGQCVPVNGKPLIWQRGEHPNVSPHTGAICLGDVDDLTDPVSALFLYPSNEGWDDAISFEGWMEKYCRHICDGDMLPQANPNLRCDNCGGPLCRNVLHVNTGIHANEACHHCDMEN